MSPVLPFLNIGLSPPECKLINFVIKPRFFSDKSISGHRLVANSDIPLDVRPPGPAVHNVYRKYHYRLISTPDSLFEGLTAYE